MKLASDKLFYITIVSTIVFYMLWNHGKAEFMTSPTGMEAAIKAGRQEEKSSDDLSDVQPGAARKAILDYIEGIGQY